MKSNASHLPRSSAITSSATNRIEPLGKTLAGNSSSDRTTLGSLAWVLVAGIVPIYRFAAESGMSWIPEAVLVLLGAALLTGRVRSLPGAAVWISSAGVILVAGAISGTSSDMSSSIRTAAALSTLVGLAPFVLRHYLVQSRAFAPRAMTAFLLVQTISAIAAIAQVAGMTVLGATANSGRANGLAGHPNVQGLMCVIALVLVVAAYRSASSKRRATLGLCGAVNFIALVATGSLSSLLSLVAALVVLIAASRAGMRTFFVGSACIAGVVVIALTVGFDPSVLFAPVSHRIDVVTGESDGVASLGIRQQTYAFAWDYIQQDPFIGVGMDPTNQGTFNGITVVHNYILHAWYQGGLALVIAIAGVSLLLLGRIFRAMTKGEKSAEAAIIAAVIVYALGSAFYDQQQYWLPLIFATASSYAVVEGGRRKHAGGALSRQRRSGTINQPRLPIVKHTT
jgi:O-antigen ligase